MVTFHVYWSRELCYLVVLAKNHSLTRLVKPTGYNTKHVKPPGAQGFKISMRSNKSSASSTTYYSGHEQTNYLSMYARSATC